jgi:hypothetical protein
MFDHRIALIPGKASCWKIGGCREFALLGTWRVSALAIAARAQLSTRTISLSMNRQTIPLIIKDLRRLGFMVPMHAQKRKEALHEPEHPTSNI